MEDIIMCSNGESLFVQDDTPYAMGTDGQLYMRLDSNAAVNIENNDIVGLCPTWDQGND